MKNEEIVLNEIQQLKNLITRLLGIDNLPPQQQLSSEVLDKAALEFQKLSIQRGEWIQSNDIDKYIRSASYDPGKFIREEFGFTNYFKKGRTYYYNKTDILKLGKELKKRNVNLKRYEELKNDQLNFEKYIQSVFGNSTGKPVKQTFKIPAHLKDIITSPAKLPELDVMRNELQKLKEELFENKFAEYIDIYKNNYAMVKYIYHFEKYIDPKIRRRISRWCEEFNTVNRILEEITKKKPEKFIPVPEKEMIRL